MEKAEKLAVDIVTLHRYLVNDKREFTISNQILRSGTSIAANIAESQYSESVSDFIHKLAISQKEANETMLWLKLLYKTSTIEESKFRPLYEQTEEILKILTSTIRTLKSKSNQSPLKLHT